MSTTEANLAEPKNSFLALDASLSFIDLLLLANSTLAVRSSALMSDTELIISAGVTKASSEAAANAIKAVLR